jgi:hypothetical protein
VRKGDKRGRSEGKEKRGEGKDKARAKPEQEHKDGKETTSVLKINLSFVLVLIFFKKKLKCLQCGHTFSPTPETKAKCVSCNGEYVILHNPQSSLEPSDGPPSSPYPRPEASLPILSGGGHVSPQDPKKAGTALRAPESAEEFLKNFESAGLPFELTDEEDSRTSEEEPRGDSKPDVFSKEISDLNSELYFKLNLYTGKNEHSVEMEQVGYVPYSLTEEEPEYVCFFCFFFILRARLFVINFSVFPFLLLIFFRLFSK